MYRLLSVHVLALIDDSVISIEMYNVVRRIHLSLHSQSSDPVSQCFDLYYGHLGQNTSLTKCLPLQIRVSTLDKDSSSSLSQWLRKCTLLLWSWGKYIFTYVFVIGRNW